MRASDHLLARVRESLRRLDPRTEWPHGAVRLGVAGCVVVTSVLGLVYFGRAVARLGDDASRNASANYDDREFGAGNALGVDKPALYEARAWIPAGESYRFVAGASVAGAEDIRMYARFFLMPRRLDPRARWVVCYACDLSSLGHGVQIVWQNDAGLAVGRLSR